MNIFNNLQVKELYLEYKLNNSSQINDFHSLKLVNCAWIENL